MEGNAMYPSMGSGMLGLEMSLQHHHQQLPPQQQNAQNARHLQQPSMVSGGFAVHDSTEQLHSHPQAHMGLKQLGYSFAAAKSKNIGLTLSDDDEPGLGTENIAEGGDGKRKMSPWQRMKWTDNMVRLLIMVVYYIGDEGTGSDNMVSPSILSRGGSSKMKNDDDEETDDD